MSDLPTPSQPGQHHHETVLWTGSVSHWHYAGSWLLCLLLVAGLVASFILPMPANVPGPVVQGVLGVLLLGVACWIWIDRRRRRYTITTDRVGVEIGLISKVSNEIRLQNIRSINLTKTGISGLFDIGRLEFSSAATDDAEIVFWNVGGATKLRDMVRKLQTET